MNECAGWIGVLGMNFDPLCYVLSCNCCVLLLLLKLFALPAFARLQPDSLVPWLARPDTSCLMGAETLGSEAATPAHPVMADLSGREVRQPFFVFLSDIYHLPVLLLKTLGHNCISLFR